MRHFLLNSTVQVIVVAMVVACSVATNQAPDSIVFSHHVHSEQGLSCEDCHAAVLDDSGRQARKPPAKPECGDCHESDSKESCATCHRNPDTPGSWPVVEESHLVFSHKAHQEYGVLCDDCHQGAAHWPDKAGQERQGLRHADCASCHKPHIEAGRCKMCHERLDLNASKPTVIYSHEPGFFDRHGQKAQGGEDLCAQCHDQSFCADCHSQNATVRPSLRYPERVDSTFMHRGDWISRHALEARTGDTGCMKCHGNSYCASCHERSGVGGALGKQNPHRDKPNWMTRNGPGSHGRAARRRIAECASCHDQGPASNCIKCHSPGGVHSFNPHPPGWKSPVPKSERTKHEMCRICHTL